MAIDQVDLAEFKASTKARLDRLTDELSVLREDMRLIASRLSLAAMGIIGTLLMLLFGIVRSKIGL